MIIFKTTEEAKKYFVCEDYIDGDFENSAGYRGTIDEMINLMKEGQELHTITGEWQYFKIDKER